MEERQQGKRFNEGKLRYDLVHPVAEKGLVKVLTKGSDKYGPKNWQIGMSWSKVIASLKRHLAAIENGEDYDLETGELHADHLQCNAHFLSAYYKIAPQFDDRDHGYLNSKKIGLDVDEVCANWLEDWCNYWKLDYPDSWYFDRNINDKFDQMRKAGKLDGFYLNLKPLIDPKSIPFEPHVYVTSRPVSTEVTEKWLDMNGFPSRPVITVGVGKSKVKALKEANIDIFIDDRFENFVDINKAGILCLLMDMPHNRRYNVGHRRIKSFQDFKERFL